MQLLYLLEKMRVPVLNELMLLITRLGEETAFLVIALIIFWCVDKRQGYYVMSVGFIGTMANQVMKLLFRVPRPWVLDENFTILEQAREAASGYSFPSGHTTCAVGTFGSIAAFSGRKWIRAVCITLAAAVGFSRMYVGVHTPYDVLVGALTSVILILVLRPVVLKGGDKQMKLLIAVMLLLGAAQLAFVELYPFPADMDQQNLQSGVKNAYTMIGCLSGVGVVYFAERKWVNFETKAVWWAQLLKAGLGLILVLAAKEGLRAPLEFLFAGQMAARAVRYFLVVLVAGFLWPLSFRWFSKLGRK